MTQKNKIFKKNRIWCIVLVALLILGTTAPVYAASQYTVTYRSGNHGTVNGGASYDVLYEKGAPFLIPSDSIVTPVAGYYFIGWSSDEYEYPATVTKKLTYVAKYRKIVNAVEYSILYVDTDGIEIATRTTDVTDASVARSITPPTIEGYTVTSNDAQIQNAANPIITFTYTRDTNTITNTETVTVPGTTTVIPGTTTVLPGTTATTTTGTTTAGTTTAGTTTAGTTTAGTTTDGTTAGTTTDTTNDTTTITEPQTPLADGTADGNTVATDDTNDEASDQTVTLTDGQTPLASEPESSGNGWFLPAAIGTGIGAIIIAGVWFILSKKRNSL